MLQSVSTFSSGPTLIPAASYQEYQGFTSGLPYMPCAVTSYSFRAAVEPCITTAQTSFNDRMFPIEQETRPEQQSPPQYPWVPWYQRHPNFRQFVSPTGESL